MLDTVFGCRSLEVDASSTKLLFEKASNGQVEVLPNILRQAADKGKALGHYEAVVTHYNAYSLQEIFERTVMLIFLCACELLVVLIEVSVDSVFRRA